MDGLTSDQRGQLTMFCEVIAEGRAPASARQLLASCNWDVEQALQLHWAAGDDPSSSGSASALGSGEQRNDLGMPLLGGGGSNAGLPNLPNANVPPAQASDARGPAQPRRGFFGRLAHGLVTAVARVGGTIATLLASFFFGQGGQGFGAVTGQQFGRALEASYSAQGQLPNFHAGSFAQALQTARQQLKLLVVYLHSDQARHTQRFCTQVLGNEFVRGMLDENFLLWGGDIARMESHHVAQMIHARQYPCFCVLLPASIDEIRAIGILNGEVEVDQVVALLTSCLDEMETHRSEIQARQSQHVEDRNLREQQDQEFQEALQLDRLRVEAAEAENELVAQAQRLESERLQEEQNLLAKIEAEKRDIESRRRAHAAALEAAGIHAEATARIAMRLPTGQRLDRKFRPDTTLAEVYTWAECCQYLPENQGKGIEIPPRFVLKQAFPSKDLTEMERSVQELQLSGASILLMEIEGPPVAAPTPEISSVPPAATLAQAPADDSEAVAQLTDMGFGADQARKALEATGGDVQKAAEKLLD